MTIVIKIIAVFYFSYIQSMAASSALQSPLIGITQTTGDVTISGVGVQPATIPAPTITNSKIANSTIDLTTKVVGSGGTFTTVGTTTPALTAHWNHGGGAVEFDIRSTADAVGSTCTTSNDSPNRTLRISVYRM
jgi:hypothetical protein